MVRYDKKVERPAKLHRLARGGDDFLAAGEAVSLLGAERVTEGRGVERIGGVQMRVAPQHLSRIIPPRVGRVSRFSERSQLIRIEGADVCPNLVGRGFLCAGWSD